MRRILLIVIIVMLTVPYAGAQLWKQKRYEAAAGIGTSQFYGDVGGYSIGENIMGFKDFSFVQTRFNISASFRYFIIDDAAARFSLSYVNLHATDDRGSNENRGLEATTSLFDQVIIGEYYFFRNQQRNNYSFQAGRGMNNISFFDFLKGIDLYILAGIGTAEYIVAGNEELVARGMKTGGVTVVFPLGLGAKMAISPDILLGLELNGRFALTDYIDGYTSQYSARNDVYHTFSFTFNYRIRTARNGLPTFR